MRVEHREIADHCECCNDPGRVTRLERCWGCSMLFRLCWDCFPPPRMFHCTRCRKDDL